MAIRTRLSLSATPGRPYTAWVAKAEAISYALYNFTAKLISFNFIAESKNFNFTAKNKNFNFIANTGA